jgi:hypothetical protein
MFFSLWAMRFLFSVASPDAGEQMLVQPDAKFHLTCCVRRSSPNTHGEYLAVQVLELTGSILLSQCGKACRFNEPTFRPLL